MKLQGFVRNSTRFTEEFNRDCVVRAFTVVTGLPYNLIREALALEGRKSDAVGFHIEPMLVKYKYEMFGKSFQRVSSIDLNGTFLCRNSGHAWAVMKGKLYDSVPGNRRAKTIWRVIDCPEESQTIELVARAKLKLALYDND